MGSEKSKLNSLRAAVLGANDGIVSVAGLVVGVAGATTDAKTIITAGLAGLVSGALSMAAGEYVSVSTQLDAERVYIAREKAELKADPEGEFEELVLYYVKKGLKRPTAEKVAGELTKHDAISAHLETEHGLIEGDLTNPFHAAYASAISFIVGGIIPVAVIVLSPKSIKVPATFMAVVVALSVTGYLSAKFSDADKHKAIRRVIFGGLFAMAATYIIGRIFGVSLS